MIAFASGVFALVVFAFLAPTLAQQNNPESLFARDSSEGVYVRDSAVTAEKMALAFRLEHLQEWNKAADVYQELLRQFADRVTPSDDKDHRIYQYTSVAIAVQQKLAKWPADGLDAYRAKFETEAAGLLQQAGNEPVALHKILSQFFITDSAKQAAIRLIDAGLEDGDFASAAWMGDQLLTLHPNLTVERPMLLYRTALAYRLAGNAALAQARADELTKNFSAAMGTVAGKDVVLAASLAEELKRAHSIGQSAQSDSWPMAFGSLDRARVPAVSGFGGAKLFTIDLVKDNLKNVTNPALRTQTILEARKARDTGLMTGVMPVVDRGELFFQDNARVYAVGLDSNLPLAGWASTYDGERNGRYAITAWSTPRNALYTLALTDDSVVAIMGQIDMPSLLAGLNLAQRDTRLVCLDRRTGKEKWVIRPSQLPGETLQQLELTGSPLVVNDNVFITAHSSGGVQFQDCYLLCFDLAGRFRYSTYIASANSGAGIYDGDIGNLNQDVPQLAYSSGRIYVLSNLGALAAVDSYDGTIVWLNVYPRHQSNNAMRQMGLRGVWGGVAPQQRVEKPWDISPVVISDGRVFVIPSDGSFLLAYDAASGAEARRIKLEETRGAETILGVIDDRIVLAGDAGQGNDEQGKVVCMNWRSAQNELLWEAKYTSKEPGKSGLRGRSFLTTDAVYVPTQTKLLKVNLRTGRIDVTYPEKDRAWDETESSGNVLITQDHMIIAGPERVNVYTDLSLATAKLDKEVQASPDDPEVRLRYAEVMFVAGKYEAAIAKLDEAIGVLGGLESSSPAPARDRIYTCAIAFAEKLAREKDDANLALAKGLFDRAGKAAISAQQQVNYRISRAKFELASKDEPAELKLLQEIIAAPSWRAVPLVQENASPMQAGAVAEKLIAELIQRSPGVYESIAAEATAAFDAAQTAADPSKLLAVAQTYPNSTVAPQALLKAADAYEAVGNPRQSVQILRQLYFKYPQASNRALVIESLTRNYLATPNHVDVAIARLAQGAKLPNNPALTKPLVLPDGTSIKDVSFAQALKALRKYHEQASSRALPTFNLPPTSTMRRSNAFITPRAPVAANITSIVAPLHDFSRNDRLVTYSAASGIAVYPVGGKEPILVSHAIKDLPINCAWQADTLFVWSGSKLVMVKPDGSAPIWEMELRTIPVVEVATRQDPGSSGPDADVPPPDLNVNPNGRALFIRGRQHIIMPGNGVPRLVLPVPIDREPAVPPAGGEQIWKVGIVSDRIILATTSGRIIAIDMADGKTIWQMRPSDRPVDRLLVTDDFVVAQVNDGSQIRVLALDTSSGQPVLHREFAVDGTGLVNLALATDGKLVFLLQDRLECKDLFEPGDRLAFAVQVRRSDGNGAFVGAIQPEQLLLSSGKIIALSDEGHFLRVYSLENGKVLHGIAGAAGANMTDAAAAAVADFVVGQPPVASGDILDTAFGLQTQASDWKVSLSAVGSRVYAIGDRTLVSYNLDQLSDNWHDNHLDDQVRRDTLVGSDFLLVLVEPQPPNRALQRLKSPTLLTIRAYSRAVPKSGRESGLLVHDFTIKSPPGIQSWQGMDGGLYYLSGDEKLYFLKGGKE